MIILLLFTPGRKLPLVCALLFHLHLLPSHQLLFMPARFICRAVGDADPILELGVLEVEPALERALVLALVGVREAAVGDLGVHIELYV